MARVFRRVELLLFIAGVEALTIQILDPYMPLLKPADANNDNAAGQSAPQPHGSSVAA